jgi:endonuclease/exonuclease/phosphatase family metal-dependent hydrolase
MKMILLIITLVFFNSLQASELCLQTINTYGVWGKNDIFKTKLKKRTKKLVGGLNSVLPCDLVLFQEVWSSAGEKILKKGLKDHKFYKPGVTNQGSYNIGLAYSTDQNQKVSHIISNTFYRNSPGSDGDLRNLPFVKIKKGYQHLLFSDYIHVLNLHLQPTSGSGTADEKLATQLSHLLDIVVYIFKEGLYDKPIILGGDFNSRLNGRAMNFIREVLEFKDSFLIVNSSYGDACTYCGKFEFTPRVIDFFLIKNGVEKSFEILKSEINLESTAANFMSDHRGIQLKLKLIKKNSPSFNLKQSLKALNDTKKFFGKVKGFDREVKLVEELVQKINGKLID